MAPTRAASTDRPDEADLPYVDQHALAIDAPRGVVWAALERYVAESIGAGNLPLLGRLLGTEPRGGFAVIERAHAQRIVLGGRHRFARYRLIFELDAAPGGGTVLRALTYAAFPGVRGSIYRALVIGTRMHVLATRGMLHAVRRRSIAGARSGAVAPGSG